MEHCSCVHQRGLSLNSDGCLDVSLSLSLTLIPILTPKKRRRKRRKRRNQMKTLAFFSFSWFFCCSWALLMETFMCLFNSAVDVDRTILEGGPMKEQ